MKIVDKRNRYTWVPAKDILGEIIPLFRKEHFVGIRQIILLDKNYHKRKNVSGLYLPIKNTTFSDIEKHIQECIDAVSNDSKSIFLKLDYEFVASHFAKKFYESGLLLKYFHPEDMRRWNAILSLVGSGADKCVTDTVDQWCEGKETKKDEVYKVLKHEKDQVVYAREMSEHILKKL